MMLLAVLAAIPVAVFATIFRQGLWNNTLTLVNVITSALVATNYYEPVADMLDGFQDSLTYVWDFVAIWLLFAVTMLALRALTDWMSQVKVHFPKPVDVAGGAIMALWVSWIVLCFSTMTLHTAPLARHFLGDFQSDPDARMFFGLMPDRVWLAWVHRESKGTFSRFGGTVPFDAKGDFVVRYSNRRGDFEAQNSFMKSSGQAKSLPGAQ